MPIACSRADERDDVQRSELLGIDRNENVF